MQLVEVPPAPLPVASPAAVGRRVLTHRARRLLKKGKLKAKFDSEAARRARLARHDDKYIAAKLAAYKADCERVEEPPSPNVQKMLTRVAERQARRGRVDLRQMDRRFWELLFVCGWRPTLADPLYWPQLWQACRDRLEWQRYRATEGIRERHGDAAPLIAEAYRKTPVRGTLYDWWISLTPEQREGIKVVSRVLYNGRDAFSGPKRTKEQRTEDRRRAEGHLEEPIDAT